MSEPLPKDLLDALCQEFGVDREYWDIWGNHHEASEECKAAILSSLGLDTSSASQLRISADARAAQHRLEQRPPAGETGTGRQRG